MGGRLAEILLHTTNIIYFIAGAVVMSFGIIALADPSLIVDLMSYIPAISQLALILNLSSISLGSAIYMTTAGSIVVVLSFMGCGGFGCGSVLKRRHGLIVAYGTITLLFMLFDIALVIYAAVNPYGIQKHVESSMLGSLQNNFKPVGIAAGGAITPPNPNNTDTEVANAWVTMQFEQACCGVTNISDYQSFNWSNSFTTPAVTSAKVPPSCCMQKVQNKIAKNTNEFIVLTTADDGLIACMEQTNPAEYTNHQGCVAYVMAEITRYNFVYVCVAAGLTALQAIILAFVMGALSEPLQKIGIV